VNGKCRKNYHVQTSETITEEGIIKQEVQTMFDQKHSQRFQDCACAHCGQTNFKNDAAFAAHVAAHEAEFMFCEVCCKKVKAEVHGFTHYETESHKPAVTQKAKKKGKLLRYSNSVFRPHPAHFSPIGKG
jgi:hypothetical protein